MVGGRHIAPADGYARLHAAAKVDGARQRAGRELYQPAGSAHPCGPAQALCAGGERAARDAAAQAADAQRQPVSRGQAPFEMRGQAVAGHHIEACAGQHHDAGRLRLGAAASQRLEDCDLAGDVQVVHAVAQAAVHHGLRRA